MKKRRKQPIGVLKFQDIKVHIENRKGTWRIDRVHNPPQWKTKMLCHYGEIINTLGVDGDAVDVFVGPNPDAAHAYIITQVRPDTGEFDEQKIMLGFDSAQSAKAMYLRHYDTPQFFGAIAAMPMDEFKRKVMGTLHGQKLIKSVHCPQTPVPLRSSLLCKAIVVGGDENCSHCGAIHERGDNGKCNQCGKAWPAATLAVPHPEADGGCKGNCPHCGTTIFADSVEKRRACHECKRPFDVLPQGKNYRLEPLSGPFQKSVPALNQETIQTLAAVKWVLPAPFDLGKSIGEELSKSFKSLKEKVAPFGLGLKDFLKKPDNWETSDNSAYPLPEGEPVIYTTPEVRRMVLAHAMQAALEITQHPKAVIEVARQRLAQGECIANQFYGGGVGIENHLPILAAIEMTAAEFRLALARLKEETELSTSLSTPLLTTAVMPEQESGEESEEELAPGEIAL